VKSEPGAFQAAAAAAAASPPAASSQASPPPLEESKVSSSSTATYRGYAFVVGNDDYQRSGYDALEHCLNDAIAMKYVLESLKWNVKAEVTLSSHHVLVI
jgi:hypothetical protein